MEKDHESVELNLDLALMEKEPDKSVELRSGDLCPKCRQGRMDYDGLLNLTCDNCGYARGGCFT